MKGTDAFSVLQEIWTRLGKKKGAATVTRSQLCENATVKAILRRTNDQPTYKLKKKGYIKHTDRKLSLTPEGRRVCGAVFGH